MTDVGAMYIGAGLAAIGIGVDVISFQDEEGTFLPCVGSRAFCGDIEEAEIAATRIA